MTTIDYGYNLITEESFIFGKYSDSQSYIKEVRIPNEYTEEDPFLIFKGIKKFSDIEQLYLQVAYLRNRYVNPKIEIVITYLLGGRSDRAFKPFHPNYLRDVMAGLINNLNFNKVWLLDPHSHVSEGVLFNSVSIPSSIFVSEVMREVLKSIPSDENQDPDIILVAPDNGALPRVKSFEEALQTHLKCYVLDVLVGTKVRTKSGDITSLTLTPTRNTVTDIKHTGKKVIYLVIDDICDGGRTFMEVSSALENFPLYGEKFLFVTHGIFSYNALTNLHDNYCKVIYPEIFDTGAVEEITMNELVKYKRNEK